LYSASLWRFIISIFIGAYKELFFHILAWFNRSKPSCFTEAGSGVGELLQNQNFLNDQQNSCHISLPSLLSAEMYSALIIVSPELSYPFAFAFNGSHTQPDFCANIIVVSHYHLPSHINQMELSYRDMLNE